MSFRPPAALLALIGAILVGVWLVRGPDGTPSTAPAEFESTAVPSTRDGPAPSPSERDEWRPAASTLQTDLVDRARDLARSEYRPAGGTVPMPLAELDFDGYRSIRFRPEAAVWRGEGAFELQLFHLGSLYDVPVRIHLVESDSIRSLRYEPGMFAFEGSASALAGLPSGSVPGFAGFRIHHPLNRPDVMDEVAAFLGASYFRVLGPGQEYGLSARGLAIDPAVRGPEEFPDFRSFWIEAPAPDAEALRFHALLESPSVVGAYRFDLRPGDPTEILVEATLIARTDVEKLGVAPMSSMFLHAPGHGPAHDDFRPRVHDSDGLQMLTGKGEWIWRPLGNGPGMHVTSLRDEAPAGFGLAQRARAFEDYLDLEARYYLRPSYWIEILEGDWGSGGVELLEIPSDSEFNDNIAAYWVPDEPFRAGEERRFRYRLSTWAGAGPDHPLARVVRTGVGWDALPGQVDPPPRSQRRFVVDFEGGVLSETGPDHELDADLSVLRGEVEGVMLQPLPGNTGVRVTFTLVPDGEAPADMRLLLHDAGRPLSETWSYVWYP